MKRIDITTVLLAVALTGLGPPALGAAGDWLGPSVTSLQSNVTYSNATDTLATYAGFNVTEIKNIGTNTINDVTVTISASTDRNDPFSLHLPGEYLKDLITAGCTYPTTVTTPVTITCRIKQLKPGFGLPGFTVFYTAPSSAGGVSPDYLKIEYKIVYAEGTNDCANGCPNSIRTYTFPAANVLLGTSNATIVKSGVPKNGARLFTGTGGFATSADPWMTRLHVPTLPVDTPYVTSLIDETEFPPSSIACINCQSALTTKLQIPESETQPRQVFMGTAGDPNSGWLQMEVLRDASLNAGQNIKFARLFYLGDDADDYVELLSCDVGYPTLDRPCIYSREQFKNNDPIIGQRGDWRFLILMMRNGRVQM